MKKIIFIMPLMAISFLASCGSNPPAPTVYTMEFNGNNCTANNETSYEEGANVSFTITPDADYNLPTSKSEIQVDGITNYDYVVSNNVGTFSCTMTANVTVTVEAIIDYRNLHFVGENCKVNASSAYDIKILTGAKMFNSKSSQMMVI